VQIQSLSIIHSKELKMSQALALRVFQNAQDCGAVTFNAKGKSGSFARAIAFAGREARHQLAAGMMYNWLQNGNYRPVLNDIVDTLVPKAQQDWIRASVPSSGMPSKDTLAGVCRQVKAVYENKRNKNGDPVVLKGEKLFMFGIVSEIVADLDGGEVVGEA
jgi:hypothetical protein